MHAPRADKRVCYLAGIADYTCSTISIPETLPLGSELEAPLRRPTLTLDTSLSILRMCRTYRDQMYSFLSKRAQMRIFGPEDLPSGLGLFPARLRRPTEEEIQILDLLATPLTVSDSHPLAASPRTGLDHDRISDILRQLHRLVARRDDPLEVAIGSFGTGRKEARS